MARTPLGPYKLVRDRGSSSQLGLTIAPVKRHNKDLFDFLLYGGIICVLIRMASLRGF